MKKNLITIWLMATAIWLMSFSPGIGAEVEYIYDNLNRIKYVIYDGQTKITYNHDFVGNRKSEITDTDGDGIADNQDPDPTQ